MKEGNKTKNQLINELAEMRKRVAELERSETGPKRRERVLQESGAMYHTFFDLAPDPMAVTDLDTGRILDVNQTFIAWSHYSRDELIGRTTKILQANQEASRLLGLSMEKVRGRAATDAAWRFIREDGTALSVEEYPVTRAVKTLRPLQESILGIERPATGDYVWVLVNALPEFDDARNLRHIVVTFMDITDRKKAEKDLYESESKFRSLAENSTAVIFVIQGEKYIYINPAFTAVTGYTFEDLSSMNFWDLISPDMRELVRSRGISRQRNEEVPPRYDLKFITKSGEERYGSFEATLIEYQGKPAILASVLDITERKRLENAIREREETLRAFFDAVHETIALIDTKGMVILANTVCAERLGITVPELVGTYLYDHFSPDVKELRKAQYERVVATAQPLYFEDTRLGRSYEQYCYPVFDKEGRVSGVTIFANDITARKKAEKDLKESEEKYRSIFDNAIEGIFQTTPDGCFISANRALAHMLGFSSPEETFATITNIGDQIYNNPEERKTHLKMIMEKGSIQGYETRLRRKDGSTLWVSINTHLVKDSSGAIHHYEGMIEDITSRKKIQDLYRIRLSLLEFSAAHSLEELLQKTLDEISGLTESPIGFYHFVGSDQTTLTLQAWSTRTMKEFCKATGKGLHYPIAEAGVWVDCIRERRPVIHNDYLALPHRKGFPEGHVQVHRELVVPIMRSGKIMAIIGVGNKPRNYTEQDIEVVSYLADIAWSITERKRMEETLKESEERYRTAIENSNDGVAIMKGSQHLYVNRKFLDIFGYTDPGEIIGKTTSMTVHPDDLDKVSEINRKRQAGEPVPAQYEFQGIKKDGTHVHIEVSAAKTTFLGETVSLAYLRDITERRHLELQLLQSQKMESIGTLAGGIAHDFNNILTAVIGYGNLLQMRIGEDDPLRVYVDQILTSSERAANLTQSLLAFSRKQVIALKPCKVNAVIQGVEKLLRRLLTEDIELKIALSDKGAAIMADITQMDQVLINLAANSRDAMPKGGSLTIAVQEVTLDDAFIMRHGYGKPGSYVLISVIDTGTGMDEATKKRIFDPFFTTKEIGKGTGLGLATVYGIIKQHNGYINVESEPGQGTTFHIYLPAVAASERTADAVPLPTKGGTETILLAEDDPMVRSLTKEILTMSGYTVIEAFDGEDAVKKFTEQKDAVALVIVDVVMPKKNGKEVYEEVRKTNPGIKVIFTSGYTGDVVIEKGVRDDTVDFIRKPLLPNELLMKVRAVLDK
jgi:PAS domain S-box-containing protein